MWKIIVYMSGLSLFHFCIEQKSVCVCVCARSCVRVCVSVSVCVWFFVTVASGFIELVFISVCETVNHTHNAKMCIIPVPQLKWLVFNSYLCLFNLILLILFKNIYFWFCTKD